MHHKKSPYFPCDIYIYKMPYKPLYFSYNQEETNNQCESKISQLTCCFFLHPLVFWRWIVLRKDSSDTVPERPVWLEVMETGIPVNKRKRMLLYYFSVFGHWVKDLIPLFHSYWPMLTMPRQKKNQNQFLCHVPLELVWPVWPASSSSTGGAVTAARSPSLGLTRLAVVVIRPPEIRSNEKSQVGNTILPIWGTSFWFLI